VLAGTVHIPGGFEVSGVSQLESARPITITNADNTGRIWVNGVYTSLDEFRGTPYMQTDLRVTVPFKIGERWQDQPIRRVLQHLQPQQPWRELRRQRRPASGSCGADAAKSKRHHECHFICTVADCSQTCAHHQPEAT
jgi:hypothetical protein